MNSYIEVRDLQYSFKDADILKGIDFNVAEGEIFGCLGRNGSGKSTLINMMSTLMQPTEGYIRICGYDVVKNAVEVRKRIGAVFENFYTPPELTPFDYLYYYGELSAIEKPVILEREEALIKTFNLEKYKHKKLSSLSEEIVRKVEICRALISYPRVLLLDEPTRGLDIVEKKRIWAFLKSVSIDESVAIFLTSHDLQEISELCDRLLVLSEGGIGYYGTVEDLAIEKGDLEKSLTAIMMGQ
jgi:ABC-2 type transport system ATP-binding protein